MYTVYTRNLWRGVFYPSSLYVHGRRIENQCVVLISDLSAWLLFVKSLGVGLTVNRK